MDLLLVTDENKSLSVHQRFWQIYVSQNKKYFCKSGKNVLTEHKELCLSINGAQSVRLEKGTIEFKNYFKQIPVPLKVMLTLSVI